MRNLWFYTDIEIRATSYALTAVLVSDDCGRDVLFSPQHRLDEAQLLAILLDEDECSLVKEQVRIFLMSNTPIDFHLGMQRLDQFNIFIN